MSRVLTQRSGMALAAKLLASGGERLSLASFRWNVAGSCQQPTVVEFRTRGTERPKKVYRHNTPGGDGMPLFFEIHARCRMCEACLKAKASSWAYRARAEMALASRTWFGTLTLSPEAQFRTLALARVRVARQGAVFEALPESEQFAARCAVVGDELTRYWKRVRKATHAPLRYLQVFEAHASGNPHVHALVHEMDPSLPVKYRDLSSQWKLGFTKFNLVPLEQNTSKIAWYVAKYLTKSAMARVRASLRYGDGGFRAERAGPPLQGGPKRRAPAIALRAELIAPQGVKGDPDETPPEWQGVCEEDWSEWSDE